jgi:hypothetical protein
MRSSRLDLFILFVGRRWRLLAERRVEAIGELTRRVMASLAKQLVPRRNLDEDRDVASGSDRHLQQRHSQSQDFVERIVQPETPVLARRDRACELDDL